MKIVVYMPLFGGTQVHPKVFKSFVEMLQEKIEGYDFVPWIHTVGPELAYNRNDAIERILGTYDPDFIMCVDADNIVPKKAISRLLASMGDDIGVVSGIYFKKTFPHSCVQGNYLPWDENLRKKHFAIAEAGFMDLDGNQTLYYRPLQYFDVVRPVDVFGMGCVLIRGSVFKALKQPYFKYHNSYMSGDYSIGLATEDMWFCSQLKHEKIKALCDPKVVAGHLIEKIIVGNEVQEESCVS